MAAPMYRKLKFWFWSRNRFSKGWSYRHYSCVRRTVNELLRYDKLVGNEKIKVEGWLKSVKKQKHVTFFHLVDGTTDKHVQVVADPSLCQCDLSYGSSVRIEGEVAVSPGQGQKVEIHATSVELFGQCDLQEYPFKPKATLSPDYTRGFLHLRPRTSSHAALLRVRNAASLAVHKFFQENDFLFVHTPIITSNDCEGAGEAFTIHNHKESILNAGDDEKKTPSASDPSSFSTSSSSSSSTTSPGTEATNVRSGNQLFFDHPAYLTVSGQLHLEAVTGAFKKAYSFGPTFRAENSVGRHHLSEFYMIEAEIAFLEDLGSLMEIMENLVKSVSVEIRQRCEDDVQLLWKTAPEGHASTVDNIMTRDFVRMSYKDAIAMLQKKSKSFQFKPEYGCDLQKEHEKYLVQACDSTPVFITDFPADIKPFYAKANSGADTVGAVDLLVPQVGELFGGSLREDRFNILRDKLEMLRLTNSLKWYLELRQFGSVPHGGFGMGFERLLQFFLGIHNIKDTIPFPRWSHNCYM